MNKRQRKKGENYVFNQRVKTRDKRRRDYTISTWLGIERAANALVEATQKIMTDNADLLMPKVNTRLTEFRYPRQ